MPPDDIAGPAETARLFAQTADRLIALSESMRIAAEEIQGRMPKRDPVEIAEALIRLRQARFDHFDRELLRDPAWELLLEVFVAEVRRGFAPLTTVGNRMNLPLTTVLRHLDLIEEKGLIVRSRDPDDLRRIQVRLSPAGSQRMNSYLSWVAGGPLFASEQA